MNEAEYGCSLWIDTEDEHPEIITKLTGIEATEIEVKGEFKITKSGKKKPLNQNLWKLISPARISDDDNIWNLCESILDITNILDQREIEVKDALSKFDNKGIQFYANMYNYWIQFRVQPEIILKMAKYQILIDFSILSFEPDDKK